MKDGSLKTLEDACARVFDEANKPSLIFGRVYTASEVVWDDHVKDTLSTGCVEGIIRRIN